MATSSIKDSTPPPAPYNATGSFSGKHITLNWDADADLETGIKTFIIYRNGNVYDTLQYPNMPLSHFTLEKGFQRWNDGDEPIPAPAPAMTFTDSSVNDTGTFVHQVACVNWLNGAGAKSAPISLNHGLVTGAKALSPAASKGSRESIYLLSNMRTKADGFYPGTMDIYDIRGRLLIRVDKGCSGLIDVERSLRASGEKIFIVRKRADHDHL